MAFLYDPFAHLTPPPPSISAYANAPEKARYGNPPKPAREKTERSGEGPLRKAPRRAAEPFPREV